MGNLPSAFQTEIEFTLPKGYQDADGVLHRHGVMRLATAGDEILPLKDPRVQQNPGYLAIIVLARVILKLGDLPFIDTKTIENLFASDMDFLQRLYERVNSSEEAVGAAASPTESAPVRVNGELRPNGARGFRAVGEA